MARLRAAVYRPGATDADRAALAAVLERAPAAEPPGSAAHGAEAGSAGPTGEGRAPQALLPRRRRLPRSRWPLVAAPVAAAVLILWISGTHGAPPAPPPSSSPFLQAGPIPFRAITPQIWQDRVDLAELFTTPDPDLHTYLLRHDVVLTTQLHSAASRVRAATTGPAVVDLRHLSAGEPTGMLTLLFTCDRPARYSWSMTGPGPTGSGTTSLSSSGPQCSGHVISATFTPRGAVPTRLVFTVPAGVRALVEVDRIRE